MVCDKPARIVKLLNRLTGNVGGPRTSRRRLPMSTVNVTLLYGAEIRYKVCSYRDIGYKCHINERGFYVNRSCRLSFEGPSTALARARFVCELQLPSVMSP
ncbi:hypothetical protein J6590_101304 [Homalodisca vitripennis]|nr:hypothetical protein J6590_101304 [Homalodisca vitripennis]